MRSTNYRRGFYMQCQQWMVHLTTLDDGSVALSLSVCSSDSGSTDLLKGSWSDCDVLFQELLTLLDSSIWSFLATHLAAHGLPTLGGYVG